jgi:8-oxo-dGTP pyrophosphatase MutT (NUDIX family)
MTNAVQQFFSTMSPVAEEQVVWLRGSMTLQLRVYLTERTPALEYVTSVRAVLMTDAGYAVLSNSDGRHVLPGGRRGADESPLDTLHREVFEETGCLLTSARSLGLMHFHHLTEKPPNYAYPYPDFVQLVFAARATRGSFAGDPDGYEDSLDFVTRSELDAIEVPSYQRLLASAAAALLAPGS